MTMAAGISLPQELRMYKVEGSDNKGNISVKKANSAGPDVYTLYRQYGTHKATKKQKVWSSNGWLQLLKISRALFSQLRFCIISSKVVRMKT